MLFEPEIPPNTGNVMRLCANTGCRLHLVRPLGFSLRDRQLQRAGLDYLDFARVIQHESWPACRAWLAERRWFAVTTRGERGHDDPRYRDGDAFVFGPETRGLPADVLADAAPDQCIKVPMLGTSRSLNLSNAVAVVVYEAWRQLSFRGSSEAPRKL